jgi:predicted DNA-binding ribbon-helix-helix protein
MIVVVYGRALLNWRWPVRFLSEEIMKSPIVKRSIIASGHKTSVSLEEPFWSSAKEICKERGLTLSDLVSEIDGNRRHGNLSSAIRLFVLDHFKARAASPASLAKLAQAAASLFA